MELGNLRYQLYKLDDESKVNAVIKDEIIWLTQKLMSELFDVGIPAINKHLKNIFENRELEENSVISKMEITASDGKKYQTKFYNLDAIISVGYRVNSIKATKFRQWATKIFLTFRRFNILKGKGRISKNQALKKAHAEYDIFNTKQVINSDFEKLIEHVKS